MEVCRDILAGKLQDVCAEPSPTEAPIYFLPTNLQMIRFAGIMCRNRLRHWLSALAGRKLSGKTG
jgi:hypothetical protein